MKKVIKVLALILAMSCFMFVFACNKTEKPNLDLSEARDNLEDREYDVEYERNIDDLFGSVVSILEADHYDNGDYIEILEFKSTKLAKSYYEVLKDEQEAEKIYFKAQINFYESLLKYCKDEMKSSEIDEIEDGIKEIKEELKEYEKEIIGINGKYVWVGTIGAIEDTH